MQSVAMIALNRMEWRARSLELDFIQASDSPNKGDFEQWLIQRLRYGVDQLSDVESEEGSRNDAKRRKGKRRQKRDNEEKRHKEDQGPRGRGEVGPRGPAGPPGRMQREAAVNSVSLEVFKMFEMQSGVLCWKMSTSQPP